MAYVAPSLSTSGLTVPSYSDISQDLIAQFRNIYGQNVYLGVDSAEYQWISAVSAKIADNMSALQLAYNGRSPLTATGAALDSIVKINGIVRKPASYSTCVVTLTGTPGAVITNGIVRDINGVFWDLPSSITISPAGTLSTTATCETPGAITASAGQLSAIATPTAGWTAVTNAAVAISGQPIETDAQLRARQALSVALSSKTMLAGTIAAIAATQNVTRYNVIENPTGTTDANGTPAHSITAVVEGGTDASIAQAIFANRGIGCYTNGTTSVTVTDPYTGASMPIRFTRPSYVPVYVSLSVHGLTGYTTATTTAIQTAIAAYLNSLQIGELVVLSELYGAALTARPDPDTPMFSIRALTLGLSATPTGTSDLTMTYNQVAQGDTAKVVITLV